ncbi:hypothetical protein UFOVP235_18 [uncultured Caudovirales phage]|uniref:Uncharacterized protein n=1 Tax=uncultured Caudovirales phage TaxID=2100421 RepID=A0A6J7WTV4_9CAUD|nr:hypothetical protein UFOVP235_18 [uncultured Caudovirales phage]
MIEQLISRTFATRNAAHVAHWQAKGSGSFARHMALDEFYNDVIDSLDSLVEAYMGVYGIIPDVPTASAPTGDILGVLSQDVRWIKTNASELTKDYSALMNLVDNISAVYLKAIYKLKNLS